MSDTAVHQDLSLAAEFPVTERADWVRLVEKTLKDRPFDKLVSRTYDGIAVEPLYRRAAGADPVVGRVRGLPWTVMQRIDHPDPVMANKQALDDLENGATGLALLLAGAPAAHGYGVKADSAEALARALDGVMPELIALRIETAPFAGRPVSELITGFVADRKRDAATLAIDFGLDPLGDMARTGRALLPWPELSKRAGATAKGLADKGYANARFLRADARPVHEAGGSEAQELAFAIAAGVDYLRLLEAAGFALDDARRRITFILAADADEFLTIAKFRAIRKLWARIEEACGLAPRHTFVAAETAWRMLTQRDPYVNMLRATIAVTAASVGGADTIAVLPHTAAIGLPDSFARRVARNTQLVLLEESNLAKVSDPAAGSGAIEHLTDALCASAWTLFQAYDKAGGAWAALEQGLIQRDVAAVREKRQTAAARRKDAITGTSDYPHLQEKAARVLNVPRMQRPKEDGATPSIEPLPSIRLAEPFERLRDKSDAILTKTGARPKVFLANLGKPSDFTARATFAKNFYEAGGLETVGNDGFPDQAAMLAAFNASRADIACVCSSDRVYEAQAAEAAKALSAAGATVHLAGRPGEHEAQWNEAGVKTYIYVGCDVLATLEAAHDIVSKP